MSWVLVLYFLLILSPIHWAFEDDLGKLNYSVIESTGKFCRGRDSCRQLRNTRGPEVFEQDWKKRNCFCDNECAIYADCCVDAPAYERRQQVVGFGRFQCRNLKQYGDIYIRSACPADWTVESIRQSCEDQQLQVKRCYCSI